MSAPRALTVLLVSGACAVSAWAPAARAEEEGIEGIQATLDEPIVSTASKSAETATVAPATSTTITAEDLRRYGIKSLDEAIDFLSLGMATSNPLHSVDVGSRGVLFTSDFGNHVLLLINGHTVNEPWDGTAYYERGAAIPLELIDHIEIILGPGSVLYGSNAMLGVINVITKKAKDYNGVHLIAEGDLSGAVGPNASLRTPSFSKSYTSDMGKTYRVGLGTGYEFKLAGRPAELAFQIEYFSQSGPAFTFGPQTYDENSAFAAPPGQTTWGGKNTNGYYTRVPAGYLHLGVGDFEVNLRAATYKRATPYINLFNQFTNVFNSGDDYEIDRWFSFDIKYKRQLSTSVSFNQRVYGDSYDFVQEVSTLAPDDCAISAANGCHNHIVGISRWLGTEAQLQGDWKNDGRFVTLIGADGRIRKVGQLFDQTDRLTGFNPGTLTQFDHNEGLFALYAQQTIAPHKVISMNVGARADFDPNFGSRFSPRAAVAVSPWQGGTLKTIYSTAFRAPTAYELYYIDPNGQVAAPDLKPETVQSVEASLEQKWGTQRLLFGVFRSWWRDMVLLDAAPQADIDAATAAGTLSPSANSVLKYQNVSSIDNYGLNAAFEGSLGIHALRYGLTLTEAQATRSPHANRPTIPLPVAPRLFGNVRVSYDFGADQGYPTVALAAHWLGKRPVDRAYDAYVQGTAYTPVPYAPMQVELRGTVSGPVPRVTGLNYRFTANYAFANRGPYVAGPTQLAVPGGQPLETAPVDRFRVGLGLEYILPL